LCNLSWLNYCSILAQILVFLFSHVAASTSLYLLLFGNWVQKITKKKQENSDFRTFAIVVKNPSAINRFQTMAARGIPITRKCDSCCRPVRARAVSDGETAPGDTVKFNPPSARAHVCVRVYMCVCVCVCVSV